jgi:hypothetical protein
MKRLALVIAATILAACSSLGIHDPGPEVRAARTLCEVMRSYRPYDPNECGEQSGGVPPAYRAYGN